MDFIGNIINYEPSNFMEETYHQVWRNFMVEVYTSMGHSAKIVWEINNEFQVTLQDQECARCQHREVQSKVCGNRVLRERGSGL